MTKDVRCCSWTGQLVSLGDTLDTTKDILYFYHRLQCSLD